MINANKGVNMHRAKLYTNSSHVYGFSGILIGRKAIDSEIFVRKLYAIITLGSMCSLSSVLERGGLFFDFLV